MTSALPSISPSMAVKHLVLVVWAGGSGAGGGWAGPGEGGGLGGKTPATRSKSARIEHSLKAEIVQTLTSKPRWQCGKKEGRLAAAFPVSVPAGPGLLFEHVLRANGSAFVARK